jgi:hypothetical protein
MVRLAPHSGNPSCDRSVSRSRITKCWTCVLEMVCRQVGANPTWLAASHEPSIEFCCLATRAGSPVRSARLKHNACVAGAEKGGEDERQGLAIPP